MAKDRQSDADLQGAIIEQLEMQLDVFTARMIRVQRLLADRAASQEELENATLAISNAKIALLQARLSLARSMR